MKRYKMRLGISSAYIMIMVPLVLGMIAYLYWSNSKVILSNTATLMERTVSVVSADVNSLIAPVVNAVETSAEIAKYNETNLKKLNGVNYFYRQMKPLPQVYSQYIGFEENGHFYQSINIPPGLNKLGTTSDELHQDARFAARLLDDNTGQLADNFIIYSNWGDIKQVYQSKVNYDPRERPWYEKAIVRETTTISDAYVFSSSGLIGLTVSHRVAKDDGIMIGAVGADITLDTLSDFLQNVAIGGKGKVFLMDQNNYIVAHPDPALSVKRSDDKITLVKATEILDPIINDAVKNWDMTTSEPFEAQLGSSNTDFLISFTPLARVEGIDWTVGIIVEKDELVGPLKKASQHILIAGSLVLIISIFGIMTFSRQLTEPIQRIVEETKKIENFDLSGQPLDTNNRISEVQQLTSAVETMKRSLSNFSIYVPKELVRIIVSGNGENAIAPRRQPLTLLFSDIKGFTNISETTSPENLVNDLSEYFDKMTHIIHDNNGVIDKYIGDAIMALWNAPVLNDNHIKDACLAMLNCKNAGHQLMDKFKNEGREPFHTRFGLHTGEAVVGNVGSSDRTQYSSFGSTVNLAARLEALNKYYGTELLVSEQIVENVKDDFLFCHRDTVVPAGISSPIKIYELCAVRDETGQPVCSDKLLNEINEWEEALHLYFNREWQQAYELFKTYLNAYPSIVGAQVMMDRCRRHIQSPPGDDWDGAEWFTTK